MQGRWWAGPQLLKWWGGLGPEKDPQRPTTDERQIA